MLPLPDYSYPDNEYALPSYIEGQKELRRQERLRELLAMPLNPDIGMFWLFPKLELGTTREINRAWRAYLDWLDALPYTVVAREINQDTLEVRELRRPHTPRLLDFLCFCQQLADIWPELLENPTTSAIAKAIEKECGKHGKQRTKDRWTTL